MEVRSKNYVRKDDFPTSLIMIDCNYLKEVNDHLGHEYGDLLLQRITNSIQETISKESIANYFINEIFQPEMEAWD